MAEPTIFEQYMLELINRSRANPEAEALRLAGLGTPPGYNGDLNEGLPSGTISSAAKQPLAFNLNLIDAAKNQSDWMLANDMANFSDRHNRIPNGQSTPVNTPAQRMAAAGYATLGTFGAGENLARTWGTNQFDLSATTLNQHNALFIDEGVTGRGHRTNMMAEAWREIGISVVAGENITQGGQSFAHSVVSTQNFAYIPNTDPFLTGVAFRDTDDDDFYTPGEGLDDVTINITGITNPGFSQSVQTMYAGGYQTQLADGSYSVEFVRGGAVVQAAQTVTIDGQNIKLDLLQEVGVNPDVGKGKIVGNKFNDLNNNGIWDPEENGLANWTIYLDSDGDRQLDAGEVSTTTDANGEYIFNNLAPGTYNVAEVLPAGWVQTLPDPSNPIGSEAYQIDSGSNGAGGGWGSAFVALNSFTTQSGLETIDSISVALRSTGNPSKVLLYSDPNGDGNPNDAVKLAEVNTSLTGGSGFASVNLPTPVTVSGSFFVGGLYAAGQFAPSDNNATDLGKSVFAVGISDDADLNSLSDEFISPSTQYFAGNSNFMFRANATGALPNIVTVDANQTIANVNFGNHQSATSAVIGEVGSISGLTHGRKIIGLQQSYINPVLIIQPTSNKGTDPVAVRIDNLDNDSFEVFLQEPSNLNGIHTFAEQASYMVIEAGNWQLADGTLLEADTFSRNGLVTGGHWSSIAFDQNFANSPAVFSQIQTFNGADFSRSRQKAATANGVDIGIQEQDSLIGSGHTTETMGYVAIEAGTGQWSGLDYEVGLTGNFVDHTFDTLNFSGIDMGPQLIASVASYNGADAVGLRYQNLGSSSVQLKLREDTTADSEIGHLKEKVSYFAIEGTGLLEGFAV